ncbi:subclass B1 metallo-beta-lactamase [Hymenobacter sp. NST-14]|uniref:subclass B1 metallo-beta-lactamase n=1 Tax=Hymenobacter piscis TaxID=2839984 RepID=UPI001C03144A|nr:subclass B1 metallo-beta-lactamase [Hymenobacter piscis]MBT9393189.1 subclass B1 metallo-beta-lactamase [Hymenobacter piscis]
MLLPLVGQAGTPPVLPPLRVRPLAPDVLVPTAYSQPPGPGKPVASNGLLVRTKQGIILIDTAWDPEQTRQLLQWVADSLHERIRLAIVTQAATARPGGLAVLREQRIRVYSSPATAARWHQQYPQQVAPTAALKPYTLIRAGRTRLELFFPGPGSAPDNVVAWLPRRRVLFGGELVRAQAATGLGQSPEANLKQWPAALRTLRRRYAKARVVVPAHGSSGDVSLLTHTQELLREQARRQPQTALTGRP